MILLTSLREVNKIAGYRGLRASAFSLPWRAAAVNYFYTWSQKPKDQRQKAAFYPREIKKELFKNKYIAQSSGHTRGSTIDLTLVKLGNLKKNSRSHLTRCYDKSAHYLNDNSIDMGTRFDCLDRSANINYPNLSKSQQKNRLLLQKLMLSHGFKPYLYEWWHYTLSNEPYPETYFNFPVN